MKRYKIVTILLIFLILILSISVGAIYSYSNNKYDLLKHDYNQMKKLKEKYSSECKDLEVDVLTLEKNIDDLQFDYSNLKSDYYDLKNRYNQLQGEYVDYTESIEFRYGYGTDCQLFITPNDGDVKIATRNALGHYSDGDLSWEDMRDINDWIHNNIYYNHDTFIGDYSNCYFYPEETLEFGYGDCEDQAVLMISMCLAEADVSWIYCARIEYDNKAHLFVILDVDGNKMFIFDPTNAKKGWFWEDGWSSEYSTTEYEALNDFANYFGISFPRVTKIFNENTYRTFNNNQDFYDYF